MLIFVSGSEQVTSTIVPGFTGNCVVVSNLLPHPVGNPGQASTGQNGAIIKLHFHLMYRGKIICYQNLVTCDNIYCGAQFIQF